MSDAHPTTIKKYRKENKELKSRIKELENEIDTRVADKVKSIIFEEYHKGEENGIRRVNEKLSRIRKEIEKIPTFTVIFSFEGDGYNMENSVLRNMIFPKQVLELFDKETKP